MIALVGWLAFGAWLVAAPGCAPNIDADGFRVDPAEQWQVNALEAAAAEWCEHGLCARLDGGSSRVSWVKGLACRGTTAAEVDGCCATNMARGNSWIRVEATLDPERMRVVLLHELGHHWGCADTDEPGLIMSDWTDAEHLTDADLACAGVQ